MELQEIMTFVSVAQHRSFSQAAGALGYSQAAVTIQVRKLEDELGTRLFDRLGKTIRLTSDGRTFYDHALTILGDVQRSRDAVSGQRELHGTVRVGTINSLCASLFPDLVTEYHRLHPGVVLSITTGSPDRLIELLLNNDLDLLYLMDRKLHEPRFVKLLEEREPVVFMGSRDNPLADGKPHSLDELSSQPVILTEKGASYRNLLEEHLQELKKELVPAAESDDTHLLLHLVIRNHAVTFLPKFFLNGEYRDFLTEIPVPECSVSVYRQLIHHRDKWVTDEMRAFIGLFLREN